MRISFAPDGPGRERKIDVGYEMMTCARDKYTVTRWNHQDWEGLVHANREIIVYGKRVTALLAALSMALGTRFKMQA